MIVFVFPLSCHASHNPSFSTAKPYPLRSAVASIAAKTLVACRNLLFPTVSSQMFELRRLLESTDAPLPFETELKVALFDSLATDSAAMQLVAEIAVRIYAAPLLLAF
jgi:hypothetical protein